MHGINPYLLMISSITDAVLIKNNLNREEYKIGIKINCLPNRIVTDDTTKKIETGDFIKIKTPHGYEFFEVIKPNYSFEYDYYDSDVVPIDESATKPGPRHMSLAGAAVAQKLYNNKGNNMNKNDITINIGTNYAPISGTSQSNVASSVTVNNTDIIKNFDELEKLISKEDGKTLTTARTEALKEKPDKNLIHNLLNGLINYGPAVAQLIELIKTAL